MGAACVTTSSIRPPQPTHTPHRKRRREEKKTKPRKREAARCYILYLRHLSVRPSTPSVRLSISFVFFLCNHIGKKVAHRDFAASHLLIYYPICFFVLFFFFLSSIFFLNFISSFFSFFFFCARGRKHWPVRLVLLLCSAAFLCRIIK